MLFRGPAAALALVWTCFVAQGVFYATAMPMWEGFDEFSHYGFLEDIALHGRLADPAHACVSREIAYALRTAPVPWMIRGWEPGWISYDSFWNLSQSDRAGRLQDLRSLPHEFASETAPTCIRNYEAQQPPLAYVVLSLPYLLANDSDVTTRLWLLRICCVLIASAVVPLTFLAVQAAVRESWLAVAGASLVAAFPQIYFDTARISNEALAVAFGAALVCVLIRNCGNPGSRSDASIGVILGCALLTKAYFASAFLIVICLVAAKCISARVGLAAALRRIGLCAGVPLIIAGWWYIRAWRITGSITGEQIGLTAATGSGGLAAGVLHAALDGSWIRIFDFALISHIWLGGWSFLVVRSWMYRSIEVLLALAAIGLAVRITRVTPAVQIAIGLEAAFGAGLAVHAVASSAVGGVGTFGHYLFAIVPAEIICLHAGWNGFGPTFTRFAVPGAATMLTAMGAFGAFIEALPYWSGMVIHDPRGALHALAPDRILTSFTIWPKNLTWGKPALCSPGFLVGAGVCFIAAGAFNVAICWRAASSIRRNTASAKRAG